MWAKVQLVVKRDEPRFEVGHAAGWAEKWMNCLVKACRTFAQPIRQLSRPWVRR